MAHTPPDLKRKAVEAVRADARARASDSEELINELRSSGVPRPRRR